jgi:hypothetical protein
MPEGPASADQSSPPTAVPGDAPQLVFVPTEYPRACLIVQFRQASRACESPRNGRATLAKAPMGVRDRWVDPTRRRRSPLHGHTATAHAHAHRLDMRGRSVHGGASQAASGAGAAESGHLLAASHLHWLHPRVYRADSRASPLRRCPSPRDARASPRDACSNPLHTRASQWDSCTHPLDGSANALDGCTNPRDSHAHPADSDARLLGTRPNPLDAHVSQQDSCAHPRDGTMEAVDSYPHPPDARADTLD